MALGVGSRAVVMTGTVAMIAVLVFVLQRSFALQAQRGAFAPVRVASDLRADAAALADGLVSIERRFDRIRKLLPKPNDELSKAEAEKRRARRVRAGIVAAHGQVRTRVADNDMSDTIFVSICSFRDLQCAPTLYDMYERAKYPRTIYVGAVEQHEPGDPSCVPARYETECHPGEWCPSDNMKTRLLDPKKSRGPTYGRYYGMLMYRGEKYFMMIDSHNRFVTHWDHIVVEMYKGLPTKKGVLAHYPEAWINPDDKTNETNAPLDNRPTTMYMCTAHWLPELGFVRMGGFIINRKAKFGKDTCRPQPFAGAGFVFSLGKMVEQVPFDPHLHYVFNGEEIAYTVRMWTHGWDIFSPSENILYHYYYRTNANKFWAILPSDWTQQRSGAERRIQWMLGTYKQNTTERHVPVDTTDKAVLIEIDKYGLGKERTLEQYYEFAGIDRSKYTLTRNFCAEYS